ncbi:MAG: hypothetical protein V4623_10575 [Pseudomonadota bacterium]
MYHIAVKRTDKWPIPLVTTLTRLIGFELRFPKLHLGIVKHGVERDSMIVDRKWYRAKDLYDAYDTQQIFLDRNHPKACALHTVLSPWHIQGRYLPKAPPFLLRFCFALIGYDWATATRAKAPLPRQPKPKHQLVQLLARLPPDQAIKHWQKLERLGAI